MLAPSRLPLDQALAQAATAKHNGDARAPSSVLLHDLWFAALQRAQSARWEAIAAALGRPPAACQRWPEKYPWYWDLLYRAAGDYALAVAVEEARIVSARLSSKPRPQSGCAGRKG